MSRVAVVTGAASGMGAAIGRHLADRGHRIALLDLDGEGAQRVAKDLRARGARALGVPVDVADRAAVEEALREVRTEFRPIEVMVTSAGLDAFESFTDISVPACGGIVARTPVPRGGTPGGVAAACAFLCLEEAGYITGQSIGVKGGWYL